MAVVGVLRLGFLLRNRAATGFVRRVPIAVVAQRLLALAAGGILFNRRRVRGDRWMLLAFARLFRCRFAVTDSLGLIHVEGDAGTEPPRGRSTTRGCLGGA